MHWYSFQITILVHKTYRINLGYDLVHLESKILKEVYYYISDENEHDILFVQHAFMLNWKFLQDMGCFPNCHVVWRDGCSGQFKIARSWYFLPRYHTLIIYKKLSIGCQMI